MRQRRRVNFEKGSVKYNDYRTRNNLATRKSRMLSQVRDDEAKDNLQKLKKENLDLKSKISTLEKELALIKDMAKGVTW
jgi:cell division protein FtsB